MKLIFVLFLLIFIKINTCHVNEDKFLIHIKNLNNIIKNKNILLSYSGIIQNNIEIYLKNLCFDPKFKHINKVFKKNTCYFRLSKKNCILYHKNTKSNFKNLIYVFNKVVKKFNLKTNKNVLRNINKYLSDVCLKNIKISKVIDKCFIKRYLYKDSLCVFRLSCKTLNKNNIMNKQNIKLITKAHKLKVLDYCNNKIKQNCIKTCFNISDCTSNELDVANYCDYRYYYTCVLYNNNYLPELNHCNKFFNGTTCI